MTSHNQTSISISVRLGSGKTAEKWKGCFRWCLHLASSQSYDFIETVEFIDKMSHLISHNLFKLVFTTLLRSYKPARHIRQNQKVSYPLGDTNMHANLGHLWILLCKITQHMNSWALWSPKNGLELFFCMPMFECSKDQINGLGQATLCYDMDNNLASKLC